MSIQFTKGDATDPKGTRIKIIVHICNDIGGWGKGFVMAISKKWKEPEREYRNWHKNGDVPDHVWFEHLDGIDGDFQERKFELGNVQFVKVSGDTWVANMIAQHNIRRDKNGLPPIRYEAVANCLQRVAQFAIRHQAGVHMPRIGCGLAGGKWDKIEEIITDQLLDQKIDVVVYDFE